MCQIMFCLKIAERGAVFQFKRQRGIKYYVGLFRGKQNPGDKIILLSEYSPG